MKKIVLGLVILAGLATTIQAKHYRKHRVNIEPLSSTTFRLTDTNHQKPHIVNLKGKDFFVISVREPGSDGRVYAVDRDGTIWWSGRISSGAGGGYLTRKGKRLVPSGGHETSNNIFHVLAKRRFHMSKTHPSHNGINNMDYEILFTPDGQALHLGNTKMMSHGCIHVGRDDIAPLFSWAKVGMPVVVMRGNYHRFLSQEINEFKNDIDNYSQGN